ncbi:MAG: Uncharacterised protein [Flavobacterium sp. SCGC AAA160-P02]|nr:MAG: Uncharacterised protein [Flavobacterium sp. SCGC AAA160-P02]
MHISEDLIDDIKNQRVILFAGAGTSMNLGLPSWSKLIEHMADEMGYEKEKFKTLGNYLELAEFYKIKKGSLGSLRSWMDTHFHSNSIQIQKSNIHKLIVDLEFHKIYTTNYDRWFEIAYDYYGKSYDKICSIYDFTQTRSNTPQIIKYHGDFDDDSSIILTETSFFNRLSLDSPLDMKLKSDSLGKSILFIGYSLSDIDIRLLLYKLQLIWGNSIETNMQPRSYIFLSNNNPIQKTVLESRNIKVMVNDENDQGKALELFLRTLYEKTNH